MIVSVFLVLLSCLSIVLFLSLLTNFGKIFDWANYWITICLLICYKILFDSSI